MLRILMGIALFTLGGYMLITSTSIDTMFVGLALEIVVLVAVD